MGKIRYALIGCIVLAGCATPQERAQEREDRINQAKATCYGMGFPYGSPDNAQCAMRMYQQAEAQRQAVNQQMMQIGAEMMRPPPQPINCYRNVFGGVTCQ